MNKYTIVLLNVLFLAITSTHPEKDKIKINVKPSSKKDRTVIKCIGADIKLVTNKEIALFKITDENLKEGVRVELGKIPDGIFLKDPTPYHNLYEKYKWTEVKRKLQVKRIHVIEILQQNVTLQVHNIINNTTDRIKEKVRLKEIVENTISSSWSEKGLPDDEIFYNVNVTFGSDSFQYENKWRNRSFQSVAMPIGFSEVGHVYIEPMQEAAVELTAAKLIVLLRVDYSAKLIGSIIVNYSHYSNYHFWAPSVANIMKAAKLKNEIITSEFLEIRCYLKPSIKVFNLSTLEPIHIIRPPKPFFGKKVKIKH